MQFETEVINEIRDTLVNHCKTLAVAESVTSGFIQAAISQAKEASGFYQGGITVYNLGQKYKHLGVEPIHAESCNCVSGKVAEQMSLSVCKLFRSDFGMAITGFSSLAPEQGINDLYAFIAIAYQGRILVTEKINARKMENQEVQVFFTNTFISRLLSVLKEEL